MPHEDRDAFGIVPITRPMRLRVIELGVDALGRLRSYGMDDRREAVIALVLAVAVPLAGMTLLDWDPVAALVVLLLNLLFGIVDDFFKILRGWSRRRESRRERVEDEFVWPLVRALASGRDRIGSENLPSEQDLARGRTQMPASLTMALGAGIMAFVLLMLHGEAGFYAHDITVWVGVLPTVLLAVFLSVFHAWNQQPHWRRAGSIRLQIALETSSVGALVGGLAFVTVTTRPGSGMGAPTLVVVSALGVFLYALYRFYSLVQLGLSSKWLEREIAARARTAARSAARAPAG